MHPLKPNTIGPSQSSPESGAQREAQVRFTPPVLDDATIDYFEAAPVRHHSIESIKTASEYRTWLLSQAESWRATERVAANPLEARKDFLAYARKCISQSQMKADQRANALTALKEAENVLDRP